MLTIKQNQRCHCNHLNELSLMRQTLVVCYLSGQCAQNLQVSLAVAIGGKLKQTVHLPNKGTEVARNSCQIWGQHT